jgi:hypothetical protein
VLFTVRRKRYLNNVSTAEPTNTSSLLQFFELISYEFDAARLHVTAADAQVRRGGDMRASDNRLIETCWYDACGSGPWLEIGPGRSVEGSRLSWLVNRLPARPFPGKGLAYERRAGAGASPAVWL